MASSQRPLFVLFRNLVAAAVLYLALLLAVQLFQPAPPSPHLAAGVGPHHDPAKVSPVTRPSGDMVRTYLSTSNFPVSFNRFANVFNRPASLVTPRDDYWGPRPHPDTEADLDLIVSECRGTYEGLEKMANVFDCLKFFADREDQYYFLPNTTARASAQDPRKSEYNDADGKGNTQSQYVSVEKARPTTEDQLGECPGPIVPFHVYWTGPATWRVEVFIKSYLMTQNLACSRLWLWLDADRDPRAVEKMLKQDKLFDRFLPFVKRGDISLHEWKFPARIPLPSDVDDLDGAGPSSSTEKPNKDGEVAIAEGIVRDANGQQWLSLMPRHMTFLPQAISDAVRFVILHLHGGLYLDMDVLLLRDMRPLLLPKDHAFAERWAAHRHPGDFNTAILSLSANSSLSSYLLRGGVRMGLNFHPRVIGRMAWKDGRDRELRMIETAAFDPIWTEFNWDREGRCTVPCIRDYSAVFKGKKGAIPGEWESYDGAPLGKAEGGNGAGNVNFRDLLARGGDAGRENPRADGRGHVVLDPGDGQGGIYTFSAAAQSDSDSDSDSEIAVPKRNGSESFSSSSSSSSSSPSSSPLSSKLDYLFRPPESEIGALVAAGDVIGPYDRTKDAFPPTNRTLENFFRGAWSYHIHNQWRKHPEPSSWFDVLMRAHDGFLAGERPNGYGEWWVGPKVRPYELWPEFL